MTLKELLNSNQNQTYVFQFDPWTVWLADTVDTFIDIGGNPDILDKYEVVSCNSTGEDYLGKPIYEVEVVENIMKSTE